MSEQHAPSTDREISGKWVIIGMALFGISMVSIMWIYWKLHLGPFVPLQQAIVATEEFRESRPVVEGGRIKSRPENPQTLRVTMKVEFDPSTHPEEVDRIEQAILALAKSSLEQFEEFELFELNLYWPKQETELKPITVQRQIPLD